MKFLMRFFSVVVVLGSRAWAQPVAIEVDSPQAIFLPGETIQLHVHIRNASGRRLLFGDDPGWLNFSVTSSTRKQVPRVRPLDTAGEFVLDSGFTATRKVEVTPSYDLNALGFYTAAATVRVRELGVELTSPVPFKFEVLRGLRLWEQEFGVPPRDGEPISAVAESRRFSLVQLRTTNYISLYYRLADASDVSPMRVTSLGQYVAFASPEAQMDRFSNLHVLFQSYRRSFLHCIISPDGDLIGRSTYDFGYSRPILKLDEKERIVVSGGLRMVSTNDLPRIDPKLFPRPLPPLPTTVEAPVKGSSKKDSTKKETAGSKPKK